ncbi:MAG: amidohydrolase, partial [Calditrichaeota bacterium]
SNWGDRFTTRYPQTRMGVEEFFRDNFQAAKDYRREWQEYEARKKKNKNLIPPRKNLRLEALLEILDGKRQIHCHSYRQDEILALIRVADEMGFKVDVFTHILEGYKVADAMKKHGSMASTFSDWWAYKFEVYDAIPYNGALMYQQGLVVGYNSDSAELARRLNTEAAKAMKYGGVPEEDAIKFATLNPAKQLHVENRVGSLEPGKDADFVIWNGPPMSTYSRCEQTWIDGRKYFDIQEDQKMRQEVARERARLVQKILQSGQGKGRKGPGGRKMASRPYRCDDVYDWVAH